MTHVMGDRTPDAFVPFYAGRDPSVDSDPFLPFLKSLDENVRLHRERADAIHAAYAKQASVGDPAQHQTWETYTAQCECLATAIERRDEAWEHRKQRKAQERRTRILTGLFVAAFPIGFYVLFLLTSH